VVAVRSGDGSKDAAAAAGTAHPGIPMRVDTPYLTASIAKTYTAAVVLRLVETGRLHFEDRLVDVVPSGTVDRILVVDGVDHTPEITVLHLLAQTSGLPDYYEGHPRDGRPLLEELLEDGDRPVDLETVLDLTRRIDPAGVPGDRAHYSDTNYRLLGEIIEQVTASPIADAYREIIFRPLGLTSTVLHSEAVARGDPLPADVFFGDRTVELPEFLALHTAEGGLVSTASESLSFIRAFFEGRLFDLSLLESERYRRIFFPMQYGFGTMRFTLPRIFSPFRPAAELLGHSGSTGSFAFRDPARDLYYAGTLNQAASPGRPFRLMLRIGRLMGKPAGSR
jgi:CubicO group peptidase (beta-lactamase class C family)